MKELIADKVYEATMLTRLDQTRVKLQTMVDRWNELGYRPCASESMLYDLAFNPAEMIQEGKMIIESDSEGLTSQQRADYLKKLKFKDAHHFLVAASVVSQDAYSERGQNLWMVKNNQVALNKKSADEILKVRSVFAENEKQIEMGEQIIMIRDLVNAINKKTFGGMRLNLADLFTQDLRSNGEDNPAVLNLETVRRLLSFV